MFGLGYVDDRTTILKTDNRPTPIRTKDVGKIQLATYGGDYVQVINTTNAGKFDFLAWGVIQGGSWGAVTQRAGAFVGEFGWQPAVKHLKPWLSAGYSYGSGDGNPNDSTHGTFFQALTTPRQYARFPFYNMMNNEDFYATLNLSRRRNWRCAAKGMPSGWPMLPTCGIPAAVLFNPRLLDIRAVPATTSAAWPTSGTSARITSSPAL